PLFFDETATLFNYLPEDASLALVGDIEGAIQRFWQDTESRYKFLKSDRERPILEPKEIFLGAEAFFTCAKPHGRWAIARSSGNGNGSDNGSAAASELSAPV